MPPRRRGGGDRPAVKKGPWLPEEDAVLRRHVAEHGEQDWSSIQSKGLLDRPGKSCRLRWVNKLQPGLKGGKFSPEEERVVLDLQAQVGNKWAMIATHLHGRTDNDVKNFWSTRQKRLARLLQEPPPRRRAVRQNSSSASSARCRELRARLQEPCSSITTFHASTYDGGQSSSQEPNEVEHGVDSRLPGALCLPAPVDSAVGRGSPSVVPSDETCAENPVPGAGAVGLASLHHAAFVEPLAAVPTALSFGPEYGSVLCDNEAHCIEPQPLVVIPADPFLHDKYFAAAAAPRRDTSGLRFDDLTPEMLDFFEQM